MAPSKIAVYGVAPRVRLDDRKIACVLPAAVRLALCHFFLRSNGSRSTAAGDYFGFGSRNIECDNIVIDGNYLFDGGRNITVRNSRLISKDAFWNAENVTVYDSIIIGEYLGWNSKNIKFVNCTIESNQGMCYMDGVKLVNCKLLNTDLAFEFSTVDAEVTTEIDSVKNPISGKIRAKAIREIILEPTQIDPEKTEIITDN